jgi:hypothetical protein
METEYEDDCIWVRIEVLLDPGDGVPVKVQTRKFCAHGAFLDYTGPTYEGRIGVVFPDLGARLAGGYSVDGTVARRDPDGLWVRFSQAIRSPAEMLMRNGLLSGVDPHPAPPDTP